MRKAIEEFARQFEFEPVIEQKGSFNPLKFSEFVVPGMGGSQLAADLLHRINPKLNLLSHRTYGLPDVPEVDFKDTLIIASSYSGNTEETVDALEEAVRRGLAVAAIATGARLIELATKHNIPYVKIPATGIQPRSALGYSFLGFLKLMGQEELIRKAHGLANSLDVKGMEGQGKDLAKNLQGYVPVIYASAANMPLAYIWKIKFNETGKIPAFYNVVPEMNHNEINSYSSSKDLSRPFHFIFLESPEDHPRIKKRMQVMKMLYEKWKLPFTIIHLEGQNELHEIFSNLVLADWAAYHVGEMYNHETQLVPVVEEFKKLMA